MGIASQKQTWVSWVGLDPCNCYQADCTDGEHTHTWTMNKTQIHNTHIFSTIVGHVNAINAMYGII